MKFLRLVSPALLLLGSCGVLWSAFTEPNQCGQHGLVCTADGAILYDAGTAEDLARADLTGQTPDLQGGCPQPSAWTQDAPMGVVGVNLAGVTGDGKGNIWVTGDHFAAHWAGGSWNVLNVSSPLSHQFGRVAYSPADQAAMALDVQSTIAFVTQLTTGGVLRSDTTSGNMGANAVGIWVSTNLAAYVALSDGSLMNWSKSNVMWSLIASVPAASTAVAGSVGGGADVVYTAAGTTLSTYNVTSKGKASVGTTSAASSLWLSSIPSHGVWLVGGAGSIMTGNNAVPPPVINSQTSNTASNLKDIAGTALGDHLWAVGAGGTIVHWSSACPMWMSDNSPTNQNLNAVWVDDAANPPTVWVVGQSTVLRRAIP